MTQKIAGIALALLLAASANAQSQLSVETAFRISFDGSAVRQTDRGTLVYEPKRLVRTGDQLVLISEGTNSDDCHACSGALSIHYLEERADGWHVVHEWLTLAGGGSWGAATSEWDISHSLLSAPVLYSEGGGTWQGCTSMLAQLVPLLPTGVGEPTDIPISFDNSGGHGDLLGAEGRIGGVRRDVGFSVRFTGSRLGKVWSSTDSYRWNGRKFELSGGRSLETC